MTSADVDRRLEEVERALDALDVDKASEEELSEAVRDLSMVVDNLRQSVWAVLQANHSGAPAGFIGRVRVRRAAEICRDVLADLYADAIPRNMPGLRVLEATLEELAKALAEAKHE